MAVLASLLCGSSGMQTSFKRFPYVVGVEGRHGHVCMGVLINKCNVLTAASCLDPGSPNPRVVFNSCNKTDGAIWNAEHGKVHRTA